MRVLLVTNEYPPPPSGGIGTFTRALAQGLTQKGHTIFVISSAEKTSMEDDNGISVHRIARTGIPLIGWLTDRIILWLRVAVLVVCREIDVVEVPEYAGLLILPVPRAPTLVRLHLSHCSIERDRGRRPNLAIAACETLELALNRRWIGVSKWIIDDTVAVFRITPDNACIIYNINTGHDVGPRQRAPSRQGRTVLYVGTISERKGAIVLASAFNEVAREFDDVRLVFVGAGAEEGSATRESIFALLSPDVRSRVEIRGQMNHEDVIQTMLTADVFACPSRLESFGLVVTEAMSCGAPVVYTRLGPGPEIIEHESSGLLCNPGDAEDVRLCISRLLSDSDLAQRLGQAGRDRVSTRFGKERCLTDTIRLYETVAGLHVRRKV